MAKPLNVEREKHVELQTGRTQVRNRRLIFCKSGDKTRRSRRGDLNIKRSE